jgi:hypothetical protein
VKSPIDEKDYTVHIDFLCDKEGKKYVNLKSVQEDLQAFSFEGLNIAFEFNFEQEIKTVLPNNGEAKTQSAFSEHRTEKQKRILQRPAGIRKKQKHQADDRASPQRVQIPEETPQKVTTKIKTVVTHRARLRVYHQT